LKRILRKRIETTGIIETFSRRNLFNYSEVQTIIIAFFYDIYEQQSFSQRR